MATKKPSKKKVTKRRSSNPKASEEAFRSFRIYPEKNFMEFRISRQTLYWTILVSFIILMQLWILKTQLDVVQVTDSLNLLIHS